MTIQLVGECVIVRSEVISGFVEASIGGLFPDLEYSDPQNAGAVASNDPFGLGAFTFARTVDDELTAELESTRLQDSGLVGI